MHFNAQFKNGSMTILLVEDDLFHLQTTRQVLRRLGHRVLTATDALEAEETWSRASAGIDVVLCDHYLGFDLGSELLGRFLEHRPDVRMVLCSGAEGNFDTPGYQFLQKPFDLPRLVHAIKETETSGERPETSSFTLKNRVG